ncbi:MFS transporter [Serinicoccus hydrothermalis]|uniref:MFS transporter n=1 Tax=Serinicoccus hydrothermalis TaxID=1758689 RepID=A0A1B1NE21_9MICO|nr:MFS transporter [Serinicoccus hydrothermalis]ANS79689.1 MFS transporter [Serinicoccus hydrothermalis]
MSGARPAGRRAALLALALLTVEFLAGMQRYLSQTVLPLVASDLDGAHLYGPLDAAAQAPLFLMLPAGAWLLSRVPVRTLMLAFTLVTVLGSATCALAPSMPVFIAGTAVRALAAGALATISLGAISRGLPARHRQLVLAGMSGVWLLSSTLGPVYAATTASLLGWRWAMVAYLPLLVLARWAVARQFPPEAEQEPTGQTVPWRWAVVLAAGAAVLALPAGGASLVAVAAGAGAMLWATARLLPPGTLRARGGRRAVLTALGVTAAAYFGATMVLSVVAYDGLGLGTASFAVVIAAPGVAWALTGLWTGAHPALEDHPFARRSRRAGGLLAAGVLVLLATTTLAPAPPCAFAGLLLGATLAGLGMGALYPDLLGRCLTQPDPDDGITADRMAGAAVLVESVGMAVATTAGYAFLGTGFGLGAGVADRAPWLYLALTVVVALMLHRLRAAARPDPAHTPAVTS